MRLNKALSCVLIICIGLTCGSQAVFPEIIDKILVIVNDEVITRREVDRKLAPLIQEFRTMYGEDILDEKINEAYRNMVEQLVREKLIVSEAKRREIRVAEAEVLEQVETVKRRFENEVEFITALDSQGLTLSELKREYRTAVMSKKLIQLVVNSRIVISPIETVAYYEEHGDDFTIPRQVKVRAILIRFGDKRGSEAALAIAKDVLGRIRGGEDFSELAKKYSDGLYAAEGGAMGYLKKGDMIDRIDAVIFSLKPGKVSDIMQTALGYHIFVVDETKDEQKLAYEEVSDRIERILVKHKSQKGLEKYITQLKENAYIEFK